MQFGNDQVHCVTFLRHSESPFRAVRPIKILSLTVVQFYGGRSECSMIAATTSICFLLVISLTEWSFYG